MVQEIRIRTNKPSDKQTFGLVACPLYYRYIYPSFLIITTMGPTHCYRNYAQYQLCISVANVELTSKSSIWTTFIMTVYLIFMYTNCVCVSQTNFYNVNDPHTQVIGEQRKLLITCANAPN